MSNNCDESCEVSPVWCSEYCDGSDYWSNSFDCNINFYFSGLCPEKLLQLQLSSEQLAGLNVTSWSVLWMTLPFAEEPPWQAELISSTMCSSSGIVDSGEQEEPVWSGCQREHSCWSWSDWASFISSVAFASGMVSLGLSFWLMKIPDHLCSLFYSVKVMFCI